MNKVLFLPLFIHFFVLLYTILKILGPQHTTIKKMIIIVAILAQHPFMTIHIIFKLIEKKSNNKNSKEVEKIMVEVSRIGENFQLVIYI